MSWLENKTVLVTGANGFIGKHLVERLSGIKGIRLLLLSRKAQISADANLLWLKGDLNELTSAFWSKNNIKAIDVVFHLGAYIPKKASEANNIEKSIDCNLSGTRTLLEGLPDNVSRIIFSSTIDVYATTKEGEILTETSNLAPVSLYGSSKLFCEHLVTVWAGQHNCGYAILRYGHIFGPGEEEYGKFIPVVIRQLLEGKTPSIYGTGRAERDFLYVDDVVEATIRAASISSNIERLNIVSGQAVKIRELVELIIKQLGIKSGIEFLRDQKDGHSLRFDNEKMRMVLGDWQFVSLEEGLAYEIEAARQIFYE